MHNAFAVPFGMSALQSTRKIWRNGEFIPWEDATVHVLSHVISCASAVWEGIRCYNTPLGPAIFRADRHMRRLVDSARIYRMELPWTATQLVEIARELVRVNDVSPCYIRPIVLRGYGSLGVYGGENPIDVYMACWPWGAYLGEDALARGVDVCVSSWNRMAPNTLPALAKCSANYMNSQLIRTEAMINGYHEGVALNVDGTVSEGSAENLFVVRDGRILTPPLAASPLEGITRETVIQLARDAGIEVAETEIPREMLYVADELFFTGTAAEISPIRSVDRIPIGSGKRGPITEMLQAEFLAIAAGERPDRYGWLTAVGVLEHAL